MMTLQLNADLIRDLNLIAEDKKLFSELKAFVKKLIARKPIVTSLTQESIIENEIEAENDGMCSMDRAIEDIKNGNVYTASSVEDLIRQCKEDEVYA